MKAVTAEKIVTWILFVFLFYCLTSIGALIAQTNLKGSEDELKGYWNEFLIQEAQAQRSPDVQKLKDAIDGVGFFRWAASKEAKEFAFWRAIEKSNEKFLKVMMSYPADSEFGLRAAVDSSFLYHAARYSNAATFRLFLDAFEGTLNNLDIFSILFGDVPLRQRKIQMLLDSSIFDPGSNKIELSENWYPTINFFADKKQFWLLEELIERDSEKSYAVFSKNPNLNYAARDFLARWSNILHLAVKQKWNQIPSEVNILSIDALNGDGETPLMRAIAESDIERARMFLEAGANPNFETEVSGIIAQRHTALTYLLKSAFSEVSRSFYYINWINQGGRKTPLKDPLRPEFSLLSVLSIHNTPCWYSTTSKADSLRKMKKPNKIMNVKLASSLQTPVCERLVKCF